MGKPVYLHLGPYRHKIDFIFMKDEEGGDFVPGKIRINSRLPIANQQSNLMHEWIHGLFDQMRVDLAPLDVFARALGFVPNDADGLEEGIVRALDASLLDSLRRNRDVLNWLLDENLP